MPTNRLVNTNFSFLQRASEGMLPASNPSNYGNATSKVINLNNNNWLSDSVVFTVDSAWRYVVHVRNTHNGPSSIHIDDVRVYGMNTATYLLCESDTVGYRFGFNGQEKDNEITGVEGSHNTAEYWMYDTRLGRRWNVDPEFKSNSGWSPFKVFNVNPILYIDPNGDTEFFYNGKWIGSDGQKNGLIAQVTNYEVARKIEKNTKKGLFVAAETPLSDPYAGIEKRNGMILINSQVLKYAFQGLIRQLGPDGVNGEFGSAMCMDSEGNFHEINPIYNKGADLSLPIDGDISAHGHPTGVTRSETYGADKPSTIKEFGVQSDEYTFKKFKTNIIYGNNGLIEKHIGLDENRNYYERVEDNRYPAINFYDSNTKLITTIRQNEAQNMTEFNRGKLGQKFDKKQESVKR